MAQQTAVEWLQECLDLHLNHEQKMQYEGLFQQAKQMEKEQIAKAWDGGNYQYFCSKITNEDFDNGYEYYEENYNKTNDK